MKNCSESWKVAQITTRGNEKSIMGSENTGRLRLLASSRSTYRALSRSRLISIEIPRIPTWLFGDNAKKNMQSRILLQTEAFHCNLLEASQIATSHFVNAASSLTCCDASKWRLIAPLPRFCSLASFDTLTCYKWTLMLQLNELCGALANEKQEESV